MSRDGIVGPRRRLHAPRVDVDAVGRTVISFGETASDRRARRAHSPPKSARATRSAERCSRSAREQMRLWNDRMERDDSRNSAPHRLRSAAHRGGRNDADVTVRDVDAFIGQRIANRANAGGRHEESKPRRARRRDATHANSVNAIVARRRRDDDDLVASGNERRGEILKMALDPADARMIPVADERDLQLASDWSDITCPTRSNAESTRSICSVVCSAESETRRRHACSGTAGGTIGCVNTPSSNSARHIAMARIGSPTTTGITGVRVAPMSKPSERSPSAMRFVCSHKSNATFRLVLQNVECGERTGHRRRRHARRENQRAAVMAQIVNDALWPATTPPTDASDLENVARRGRPRRCNPK